MNNLTAIRTELHSANRAVSELQRTLRMYKNRQSELNAEIDRFMKLPNASSSYTLSELKNELDKTDKKIKSLSTELEQAEAKETELQKKFSTAKDKQRDAALSKIRTLLSKRDECIAEASALDKELQAVISEAEKQNYFLNKFPIIRDNLKITFDEIPSNWEGVVFTQKTVTVGGVTEKL